MNARLVELAERRAALAATAAAQRAELSRRVAPWRGALAVADLGVAAVRYFRSHPERLAVMVAFAAVIRPRRVAGWFRRGWALWRTARTVKQKLTGA